jgi:hypothetical protein
MQRKGHGGEAEKWPLVQTAFALRDSGLVEIHLATPGLGRRPGIICESAIWVRALAVQ